LDRNAFGETVLSEVSVPQHERTHARVELLSRSVIAVAIAAILFGVCSCFVGFHHSLFDFHGFRQTQTAITAEFMEHGGAFLRYQTPVLGPPWSIPFEFPLYQKIVALIAEHFHVPLDETGRAVSIVFFVLCFWPFASILKHLRYTPVQILAILSLLAVSPLYILVSRMFMIESMALFLSLIYVDMIFRLVDKDRPWRYRPLFLAALFGSLAGLVKVTTFAPFLILGSAVGLWQLWAQRSSHKLTRSRVAVVIFLGGLFPVLITVWWTEFAGMVRAQNPFGALYLTHLGTWNFGTIAERLHAANYAHFLHAVAGQAGSLPLLLILVLVYALVVRSWNIHALVALALYVITTMIFFHLHLIHEYYPYSCAIFLLAAAGFLIAKLLSLPGPRAWFGFAFLVAIIVTCVMRYHNGFYRLQKWNAPGHAEAAAIIDRTTNPDDVIVITGLGWSSELPYQSQRRSITDFAGPFGPFPHPLVPLVDAMLNQGPQTIPEVVVCDRSRGTEFAGALLKLTGIPDTTTLHADNCDIYTRKTR
jgi:hypothetical protein